MNEYANTRQAKLPGLVAGINGGYVGSLSNLMPIHDTEEFRDEGEYY